MKNHFSIGIECDYSFDMLYAAAYGKRLSPDKKEELQNLPQTEINTLVLKWAQKADWYTEPRIGLDGIEYIAFWEIATK